MDRLSGHVVALLALVRAAIELRDALERVRRHRGAEPAAAGRPGRRPIEPGPAPPTPADAPPHPAAPGEAAA